MKIRIANCLERVMILQYETQLLFNQRGGSLVGIFFIATMGKTKIYKCFSFFIILITLFSQRTLSDVYTVGDELSWNTGANYGSWSQKYNFSVGDTLVFKYVKGQHDVLEVNEATYQSCNTSNGVLAKHDSGNDEIELNQAKRCWFICGFDGHCLGGMRFFVDVKESNATTNTSSPNNGGPGPIPPQPANSCTTNHALGRWSLCIHSLVALRILTQLFG